MNTRPFKYKKILLLPVELSVRQLFTIYLLLISNAMNLFIE